MYKFLLALTLLLLLPVVTYAVPSYSFSPEILVLETNVESNIDLRIHGATDTNAVEIVLNYSEGLEIIRIVENTGFLGLNKKVGDGIATIDLAKVGHSNFTEGETIATVTVKLVYGNTGSITINTLPPGESGSDIVVSTTTSASSNKIELYTPGEFEKVFSNIGEVRVGGIELVKIIGLVVVVLSLPVLAAFFLVKAKRARAIQL